MMTIPLYFGRKDFGFALFKVGPRDVHTYVALSQRISAALANELLRQEIADQDRLVADHRQQFRRFERPELAV